jgi:hypothetical protein
MPPLRRPTRPWVRDAYWRRAVGLPVTHPEAMAYLAQRHDEDPEAGLYVTRLRKGAPLVPARITLHQATDENGDLAEPEIMRLEIDGKSVRNVERWWLRLRAVTEARFIEITAERERGDALGDAWRASLAPIDLTRMPVT